MIRRLPVLAFFAVALVSGAACSKLTEPPKQEQIQSEPPAGGSAAASGSAPSNPHGDHPKPQPLESARAQLGITVDAGPEQPLVKTILSPGKGPEAKDGDTVKVHYVGTLPDGKEFDSSRKRNEPFQFKIGAGNVIKGWDQGVPGMKVGEKRKLTIPPTLGYGARGVPGTIPPNSPLIFEVELVEVVGKK
jgi:FKBP-type peptidyl-prolyl cis-trans isomerase